MKPEERFARSSVNCTHGYNVLTRDAFVRELREALLEAAGICDEESKSITSIMTATSAAQRIRALAGGEETPTLGGVPIYVDKNAPPGMATPINAPQPLTEGRVREIVDDQIQKQVMDSPKIANPLMRRNMVLTAIDNALSSLSIRSEEKP